MKKKMGRTDYRWKDNTIITKRQTMDQGFRGFKSKNEQIIEELHKSVKVSLKLKMKTTRVMFNEITQS